jgi:hypothetical protein
VRLDSHQRLWNEVRNGVITTTEIVCEIMSEEETYIGSLSKTKSADVDCGVRDSLTTTDDVHGGSTYFP